MKIKRVVSQNRRDLKVDYECEHCGHIVKDQYGYDDDNFHRNVIPAMPCGECGRTASDEYRPLQPKYAANEVI